MERTVTVREAYYGEMGMKVEGSGGNCKCDAKVSLPSVVSQFNPPMNILL